MRPTARGNRPDQQAPAALTLWRATLYRSSWIRVLLAAIAAVSCTLATAANNDPAEASAELARIAARLNDLDSWLNLADRRQAELQQSLRNTDRQIATTVAAAQDAAAAMREARKRIKMLAAQKEQLTAEREEQAGEIAEHMTAMQRLDGRDLFKQLLNQERPEELERMLRYHRYFGEARIAAVGRFQQTVKELDRNAEQAATEQSQLALEQTRLKREQQAQEQARSEQQRLVEKLTAERADRTRTREHLVADRTRLEQLLEELARRSRELDGTGFANNKGQLPPPLQARIAKAYGSKRDDGELTWNGVLYRTDTGASVQAVYPGRVVFADWLRGYGLLLILDHGGGYMTLYGHADSLEKAVGDWVESGEPVATAGRSGGQRRAGLYFEVRHKGKTDDPVNWLKRRS